MATLAAAKVDYGPLKLKPGDTVIADGIQSRQDLHGQQGTVLSWVEESGRHEVEFDIADNYIGLNHLGTNMNVHVSQADGHAM